MIYFSVAQSFWNFVQGMEGLLTCSLQNFKMIGRLKCLLWVNVILHDLSQVFEGILYIVVVTVYCNSLCTQLFSWLMSNHAFAVYTILQWLYQILKCILKWDKKLSAQNPHIFIIICDYRLIMPGAGASSSIILTCFIYGYKTERKEETVASRKWHGMIWISCSGEFHCC